MKTSEETCGKLAIGHMGVRTETQVNVRSLLLDLHALAEKAKYVVKEDYKSRSDFQRVLDRKNAEIFIALCGERIMAAFRDF